MEYSVLWLLVTINEFRKPVLNIPQSLPILKLLNFTFWYTLKNYWLVAFRPHVLNCVSKLLSISAVNLKSLKFPWFESSLSKLLPSSLWPLKPIPCRPHYSIARITDERNFYSAFLNILNFVLHGHSIFFMVVMKFSKRAMESLWYWRIECPLSSSDPCFQSLYGWVIKILALLLSLAAIGNKTHAR